MIQLTLERIYSGKDSSLGTLWLNRSWLCFILEDEYRTRKVFAETRIPAGTYWIGFRKTGGFHQRYGDRFPDMHMGMLWVRGVPNFEHVLIHIGNTDEDTAGCLLVGDGARYNDDGEVTVQRSMAAYKRVYPQIASALERGEDCVLNIVDRDRN